MKKLLYSPLLAAMACFIACTGNGYKLTGTANGATDGDTVILATVTDRQLDTIATTTVRNGHFEFTGTQDTAAIYLVIWSASENPELSLAAQVALENANITVEMDTAANIPSKVHGTPANEALTKLGEEELAINKRGEDIYRIFQDTAATDEQHAAAQQQLEQLQKEFVNLYKKFISDNIDNIAGVTYLSQYASLLQEQDVMDLLPKVPAQFVNEQITQLREIYDVKAQTAVGCSLKDIKASTPDGMELAVSDVAKSAKVLLIDFWASWCGPCRAEMPNVKAVYDKFHSQGFEIIGVSLDTKAEAWKQAISELGMTWPQISDLKGWECEGAATYGVQAIPATVLVKDGKIVARDLRGDELAAKVEELLK